MPWNWQLADWPHFYYDSESLISKEKQFLLNLGGTLTLLQRMEKQECRQLLVELFVQEGTSSSKIEGVELDRESLQSSLKRHFGLSRDPRKRARKEEGMAELLCDAYDTFAEPLTHEVLWNWHAMLFAESSQIDEVGKYRSHPEPMQIVSGRYGNDRVFFEAPPSAKVPQEMAQFLDWFNSTRSNSILGRAALAHLYFENIHPFEDGNGRIGRALIEKVISQGVGRPVVMAVSQQLEQRKKEYYAALETCNRSLKADGWVQFFVDVVMEAEGASRHLLNFVMEKSRMLTALKGQINSRQEKALLRMFECGPAGFKGGLSAENYMTITKASRATTTRDLAELVRLEALVKTGTLRHTRYWLNVKF